MSTQENLSILKPKGIDFRNYLVPESTNKINFMKTFSNFFQTITDENNSPFFDSNFSTSYDDISNSTNFTDITNSTTSNDNSISMNFTENLNNFTDISNSTNLTDRFVDDTKVWCRFADDDYSQSGFQVKIAFLLG